MKFRDSFYNHGCTEIVANYIVDYGLWHPLSESLHGNERVMYVGCGPESDQLWEVGVELYPEGEEDWAFHAQPATNFSQKEVGI